jgi:hypothetical protein
VSEDRGEIVVIAPETGHVVQRFSTPLRPETIAFSADARRMVLLSEDDRQRDPPFPHRLSSFDLVEGRLVFDRPVAIEPRFYVGLVANPGAIAVIECQNGDYHDMHCAPRRFDAGTGAPLDPPPRSPTSRHGFQEHPSTGSAQYSADGRLLLARYDAMWNVLFTTNPPSALVSLYGWCSELDAQGQLLWHEDVPGMRQAAQGRLLAERIPTPDVPRCPPPPERSPGGRFEVDMPQLPDRPDGSSVYGVRIVDARARTAVMMPAFQATYSWDLYPQIGAAHDLTWTRNYYETPQRVLLMRADREELPRWLPAVRQAGRITPRRTLIWGPDEAGVIRDIGIASLDERGSFTVSLPRGGPWHVDRFAPDLPDGKLILTAPHGAEHLLVTPGPRPTALPLSWPKLDWSTTSSTLVGDRYLLAGDAQRGVMVVDLRSRRRVGTLDRQTERSADPLPGGDGRTVMLLGETEEEGPIDRLDRLELPSGRLLASWTIPPVVVGGLGNGGKFDPISGWLQQDRVLWLRGGFNYGQSCIVYGRCQVTFVDVRGPQATVRQVTAPRTEMVTGAPDGAFFAQETAGHHGLHLFTPDGRVFLTVGAFGNGAFAFTPDHRYACTYDGCQTLRCTVAGRSEPIDHPACRAGRRPGFSIDAELARAR